MGHRILLMPAVQASCQLGVDFSVLPAPVPLDDGFVDSEEVFAAPPLSGFEPPASVDGFDDAPLLDVVELDRRLSVA
jgi:hypothetical protein